MKILLFVAIMALCLSPSTGRAAMFDNPQSAVITPQGARLEIVAQHTVKEVHGQTMVDVHVPLSAQIATLDVAEPRGVSVLRWSVDTVSLESQDASGAAQTRQGLLQERDRLQGDIAVLRTRQALWNMVPTDWTQEKLDARETRLATVLPQVVATLAQKERDLTALNARIKALPASTENVQRVRVLVTGDVKDAAKIKLRYSYTMEDCSWEPFYRINAQKDSIIVVMEAMVEQHSGFDWNQTKVTLSLQNTTERRPPNLSPWIIRSLRNTQNMLLGDGAAPMRAAESKEKSRPPRATAFTSEYGAGWQLDTSVRVPEGISYLPIMQEVWMDALQRVARPSLGDNRVWLTAVHKFTDIPLPPGKALYMLDGSYVGEGPFAPKPDRVDLAFGADPLCTVRTERDSRITGSEGVIDRRQTWQWGWTYTALNNRENDVTIRIEDSAPQIGDKDIVVKLDDTPAASKEGNHTLYWDVRVPAKGSAQVRHMVHVDAPRQMNVSVGR